MAFESFIEESRETINLELQTARFKCLLQLLHAQNNEKCDIS